MNNKLRLTFGYKDTEFTRDVTIAGIEDSLTSGIKGKIKAVNQSLSGGTSNGLNTFFRSDDYDADAGVGTFNKITAARLESTETTEIPILEEEEEEVSDNG